MLIGTTSEIQQRKGEPKFTLASGGFGNDGGQNEKILGENSKIANFLITAM